MTYIGCVRSFILTITVHTMSVTYTSESDLSLISTEHNCNTNYTIDTFLESHNQNFGYREAGRGADPGRGRKGQVHSHPKYGTEGTQSDVLLLAPKVVACYVHCGVVDDLPIVKLHEPSGSPIILAFPHSGSWETVAGFSATGRNVKKGKVAKLFFSPQHVTVTQKRPEIRAMAHSYNITSTDIHMWSINSYHFQ